jgi:hypothetical protein
MAIDNALEKIRNLTNEDDSELLSSLLQAGGLFSPVIAVLAAVKGVADISDVRARIRTAIRSLCDELERIRDSWPALPLARVSVVLGWHSKVLPRWGGTFSAQHVEASTYFRCWRLPKPPSGNRTESHSPNARPISCAPGNFSGAK